MAATLKQPHQFIEHPVLYYTAKKGAIHQWRVWANGDTVYTEFGQVGGKQQQTPGKKCVPTNVGQANMRDACAQAALVAQAMHQFKLDRKYGLTPEAAKNAKSDLPMLAQRYDERAKHIKFPCHMQVKLDGNRAAARWVGDRIELVSRSGTDTYDVPHLIKELEAILPRGYELDGELYVHGVPSNTINSWVSKAHPESVDIQYWVYDMPVIRGLVDPDWEDRWVEMTKILHQQRVMVAAPHVVQVTSSLVNSDAEVKAHHERFVAEGYEGGIIRNMHGKYEWGDRSNHLQKVKSFDDAEFLIVGCREGVGKMAGCAIWQCAADAKQNFDCVMKCSMAERRNQWRDHAKYIGSMMTVSFFGKYPTGIPRFPRAIKFRLAKDR